MWPLFGLVTLVVATAFAVRRRLTRRWQGVSASLLASDAEGDAGAPLAYRSWTVLRGKRPPILQFGVATTSTLDFECTPESAVDRFFKNAGLVVEFQIGDAAFDDAIFLSAEDPAVLDMLRDDPQIMRTLARLFAPGPHPDYRTRRVVCRGGTLRIDVQETGYLPGRQSAMTQAVVPKLHAIARRLPGLLPKDRRRDPLLWRTLAVLGVSSGLAIHGAVHLARLMFFTGSFTLDVRQLAVVAAVVGAILLAALVMFTMAMLARTSRLHLVLAEVLLVGSFGCLATAFVGVRDVNMALDVSPPQELHAVVADKYSRKSRRTIRRYYLALAAPPAGLPERVRVGYGVYSAVVPGECVRVVRRDGWLGIAWVDRVEPGASDC